jgi:hypothetical protein
MPLKTLAAVAVVVVAVPVPTVIAQPRATASKTDGVHGTTHQSPDVVDSSDAPKAAATQLTVKRMPNFSPPASAPSNGRTSSSRKA